MQCDHFEERRQARFCRFLGEPISKAERRQEMGPSLLVCFIFADQMKTKQRRKTGRSNAGDRPARKGFLKFGLVTIP